MTYQLSAKIALILGLTGLADAVYLTVKHFTGGSVPCALTGGCDTVLTSQFSTFGGLPVALWGAGYYLVIILLAALYLSTERPRFLGLVFGLSTAGVLVSAVLIFIQWQILAAWCAYCLLSAAITAIIFLSLLFSKPA